MADTIWIVRHGIRRDMVDPQWRLRARRPEDPGLSPDGWVQARETADAAFDRAATTARRLTQMHAGALSLASMKK